eukprot:11406749-Karenia_brevis.AAC.1
MEEDEHPLPVLGLESKKVVCSIVTTVKSECEEVVAAADASVLAELRGFIAHGQVLDSPVGKEQLNTKPPQGTLARLARRWDRELHPANKAYRWKTKKEFRREVRRIERCYKPSRKQKRRRRGIRRGEGGAPPLRPQTMQYRHPTPAGAY